MTPSFHIIPILLFVNIPKLCSTNNLKCYPIIYRVLRRVFGPKRDEVTGEWRKLHNELSDLYSLTQYCAGGKIENEMGGACGAYGGGERCAQGSGE
jgi:hypothetical protein